LFIAPLFFEVRKVPHLLHFALNPGLSFGTFCKRSQFLQILILGYESKASKFFETAIITS
jgi:hypothetical protein